jgi:VanZ family protein
MCVVFAASADNHSYQHSSRILAPLLHWLFPHASKDTVDFIVLIARKCAHLTEYAILALLFWRAWRKPVKNDLRPWSWRQAGLAVLFVALYASTDEFHQRFVATREPSVHDVVIDTTGAALGMLCLWAFWRWRLAKRGGVFEKEQPAAAQGAEGTSNG